MIDPKDLPPPNDRYPIRRALLSVSDKTGLADFARKLAAHGVDLVSTGGTARALREAGLNVTDVAALTGSPEVMDGRVKTLHPIVHAGILARRNDPADAADLEKLGAKPIDLVVVNLYPFSEATKSTDVTDATAVENIDIGGPTMVRAAAKNFFFTAVVTSPEDYERVAAELDRTGGALGLVTRRELAGRAFTHTAEYDAAIAAYFSRAGDESDAMGDAFRMALPKAQDLRYGENPHQEAAFYGHPSRYFRQLHGKELSYNNILDLSGALLVIDEFAGDDPTVAILKHTNPCGVATASTLHDAWRKAFETDRQSPFGGIVVSNQPLDEETASAIDEIFTEIVIAPDFEDGVLDLLRAKKNRRLIQSISAARNDTAPYVRAVIGGILVQQRDRASGSAATLRAECRVVTERAPTETEWQDLLFAWRVAKHVKSNAIVYGRDRGTLGIGAGQMSRIDASEIAVAKGRKSGLTFEGSVVASDAFFPFADGLLAAAACGARAAIQPGGSVRDEEVIAAANENGIAMVFTGRRHFLH